MKAVTDIDIQLTPREMSRCQTPGRDVSRQMMENFEKAVSTALSCAAPLIVYEFAEFKRMPNDKVFVVPVGRDQHFEVNMGTQADSLDGAEILMIVAHSIGPELDARAKKLNDKGLYLESYLLDFAGLSALNKVGIHGQKIAEAKAKQKGWGVSASLSPGSVDGWDVRDQKTLHCLLDLERYGISLTESCMLVPFKTVISVIGIGLGYKSKKVGSVCRLCSLRENCLQRRD
ncbi:MAG: hypothetical protein R6V41_12460 [Desulfobacteraceae bacterium]